ncbi:LAME_0H09274g1_1 [Lachancea meyersii CBS 8951]|uniref:LAME_0H09274g1_1 n=1 Tax=Lachancea meyersii CBS 8951 TaxID=1266667 RepID=A0A1G4KFM3_9SACH|nr:LAME_0H09274g1_1 [Lachancea meyersii CBS 8951]
MSSGILTADITQGPFSVAANTTQNERTRLMNDALANAVWSAHNTGDQRLVTVNQPLLFQICMVENIGRSKASQLDTLRSRIDPRTQRVDRVGASKTPTDRRLVTSVDVETDVSTDSNLQGPDKSVFKLTLQDRSGAMYFAINVSPLNFLKNDGSSCVLGSKLVILPGAVFSRGMFLLRDSCVMFMGGMIQSWNRGRDHKMCAYLEAQLDLAKPKGSSASRKRKATAVEGE